MKDESDSLDKMVEACSEVILAVQKGRRFGLSAQIPDTRVLYRTRLQERMDALQVEIDNVRDEWSL